MFCKLCSEKSFFFPTPFWEGHQPVFSFFITLLPGSVGLSHHLLGSPEPNSGCRSYNKAKVGAYVHVSPFSGDL